jgi:hypothetical protein
MISNLEVLDKIVDCSNGKGYFHNINALLIKGRFTDKEKIVAEQFLFNPSRAYAIEALNITPKSYVFLKNYMDEGEVISEMVNVIDNKNITMLILRH